MHLLSGMLCWHAIKVWCLKEIALELKDKKPVQYDIPVNEDHFDEDHYKQLREDERYYATTNDSGINLRSLQDALMEIDQDIQANDDSTELYHDLNPTPNEHMAYHLPKQLQTFGPANFLASWHFEQINGILQKCPTNNKIAELDYTLLKHAGRASNLGVLLESAQLPPLLARIAPLLSQKKKLRSPIGDLNEEHQELLKFDKKFLSNYKTNLKIPPYIYSRAIKLLQTREPSNSRTKYISEYKQRGNFSQHEVPVPTLDKSTRHHKHSGLTYTDSSDKGSSSIKYSLSLNERQSCFGKIQQIFQILLRVHKDQYKLHTFFCVQRLENLSPRDESKNPYKAFCPGLNVHVFYSPPILPEKDKLRACDLITPKNIMYHTATFQHDLKEFGTEHNLIAVKSLSRSRAGMFT
ncbi:hypothetical protein PSTG_17734 [Puccinia striiformis f. sp. tritici PST-78]|uniref:Uncharacterized protein n=1 Tax=Puccinia striiformis f. sp. tritici PST-78 TaxID=1165861 RepID=A0A0L0UP97_9BASI|nr:hypothetical protein PSTG_17734 [Puccinia striiformis f. sp. tritici PST-78]